MVIENNASGKLTEAEILSEPGCWKVTLGRLGSDGQVDRLLAESSSAPEWLFVGCGSSYYIALAAAASWTSLTGRPARAVPASELLLFPNLIYSASHPLQPVLISRSGHTSEVLRVAEDLRAKEIHSLAVTCAPGQDLEKLASRTLCLPEADEQSMVMTRSFTSMLLGLQFTAARLAGNTPFLESLGRLPAPSQAMLDSVVPAVNHFVQERRFADYVFLGQGPFYGLACEGALKVKEMSCSYAQCFHTLEFRHGPKSIVGPETLITFFLSDSGFEEELEVLEEVKSLGGTTLAIVNRGSSRAARAADLLLDLRLEQNEYARLAASLVPCQLLGLYTGIQKGHNPDQPRHLSRVVILND